MEVREVLRSTIRSFRTVFPLSNGLWEAISFHRRLDASVLVFFHRRFEVGFGALSDVWGESVGLDLTEQAPPSAESLVVLVACLGRGLVLKDWDVVAQITEFVQSLVRNSKVVGTSSWDTSKGVGALRALVTTEPEHVVDGDEVRVLAGRRNCGVGWLGSAKNVML